jgi:PmbA protein
MNRYEAADYAIDALKKAGATQAQVSASEGYTEELNAEAGEFSLYRTLFNSSLSFKAIKDGKKGVAVINVLEKSAIDEAVAGCLASAEAGVFDDCEGIAELTENKSFSDGALSCDKDALYDRTKEFLAEVKEKYPKINLEQFISKYNRSDAYFINTNGVKQETATGDYSFSVSIVGQDGEKSTSFNYIGGKTDDISKKFIDLANVRSTIEDTLNSFDPIAVEGKHVGQIILSPGVFMEMTYMASFMFIGEGSLIEGTALWKDKLNETVTHPSLTISMNPSDGRIICGQRVTGDGYVAEDMDIIKDGVLKTFILSLYGSKKVKQERSKNQSFALIVKPGDKTLEDMIKNIDNGILVNGWSGGSPAPNGDFSGVAKNSFLIKNGKIDKPLNETMISGNIEDMFKNVAGISKETIEDGHCVMPWIAVDGVTISGK